MALSGYGKFQQEYEEAGEREFAALSKLPVPELLDRVRAGKFKDQFPLWRVIAAKATLVQAGWALFGVLESDADYLNRYHCAAALIQLGGKPLAGFTPVGLSGGKAHGTAENLAKVREVLEAAIGTAT